MLKRFGYFCMAPLVLLAWYLLAMVVQNGTLLFCGITFGMTYLEVYPVMVLTSHISYILVFGLWYGLGLKKFGYTGERVKKVATPRNILGIVTLSLGAAFFVPFGMVLLEPFLPKAILESYKEIIEASQMGENLFTDFTGCFLAPIGEELFFRGVMLYFLLKGIKGLKKEKGLFWVVNLVQAVAFGAFHGNVYQFIYTTIFGMLLGYMVYKGNTVLVSVRIHMVYNITQFLFMDAVGNALPVNTVLYVLITVAGLAVIIVGMFIVKFPKEESQIEAPAA